MLLQPRKYTLLLLGKAASARDSDYLDLEVGFPTSRNKRLEIRLIELRADNIVSMGGTLREWWRTEVRGPIGWISKEELLQNPFAFCLKYLVTKFIYYVNASEGFNVSETHESLEDEEHPRRAEAVDSRELEEAVESDPTQTTQWVPQKLSDTNEAALAAIAGILIRKTKNSSFYDSIMTSAEKWIHNDNTRSRNGWDFEGNVEA
ncbi:unnamed protein product [Heligmosomoides polygyrus]|uniref:TGc domain-containing protein n=1 Tax=Heligmosomoides polygyrus TaxID=6339 RepID=A0A183G5G9_HELPZ|nr:unnamed protein product [Heligmosomoides polygyrus]